MFDRQIKRSQQCNTIYTGFIILFGSDLEDNNCRVVCVGRNALEKISKASNVEFKMDRNHL